MAVIPVRVRAGPQRFQKNKKNFEQEKTEGTESGDCKMQNAKCKLKNVLFDFLRFLCFLLLTALKLSLKRQR
jgi:hypothetical protein